MKRFHPLHLVLVVLPLLMAVGLATGSPEADRIRAAGDEAADAIERLEGELARSKAVNADLVREITRVNREHQLRVEEIEALKAQLAGRPSPEPSPDPLPGVPGEGVGLGVNLEALVTHDGSRPFVNAAHLLSEPKTLDGKPHPGPFHPDGYPLSSWKSGGELVAYPDGEYALSHSGKGKVAVSGKGKLVRPGVVDVRASRGARLEISVTDVDPADPVRDLKLITPGEDAGATFTKLFVEGLRPFRVIRFMDWGNTNRTPLVRFADRRTPASFPQTKIRALAGGKTDRPGVAFEFMAELCNAAGCDAWVCVPDTFDDDDDVRAMAELFRDRLAPGRKLYLEWSNEVWNGNFDQHRRLMALAAASGRSLQHEHAFQTQRVNDIFKRAWGDRAGDVRTVFATHTADASGAWTFKALSYLEASTKVPVKTWLHSVAVSGYRKPEGDTGLNSDDSLDVAFAKIRKRCDEQWVKTRQHGDWARHFGVGVTVYEAALEVPGGLMEKDAARKGVREVRNEIQTDPRMADAVGWVLDAVVRDAGVDGVVCHYTFAGKRGVEGRWSLTPSVLRGADQEPKLRGALEWARAAREE